MDYTNYPENKAIEVWEKEGLWYSIIVHGSLGHHCGYVRFSKRPVKEDGYWGILTYVPVHGGITYANSDDEGRVYGFDCAHCDDETNPDLRNIEWLKAECERMGSAIALIAKYEKRYLRATTNKGRAKILDEYHTELKDAGNNAFNVQDNFGASINLLCGKL